MLQLLLRLLYSQLQHEKKDEDELNVRLTGRD